jgi:hypothetical protein
LGCVLTRPTFNTFQPLSEAILAGVDPKISNMLQIRDNEEEEHASFVAYGGLKLGRFFILLLIIMNCACDILIAIFANFF